MLDDLQVKEKVRDCVKLVTAIYVNEARTLGLCEKLQHKTNIKNNKKYGIF